MSKPEKVGSPKESSAKETTKQLLLVEDNEINMRVSDPNSSENHFKT